MKYYDFLEISEKKMVKQLEVLIEKYKVQLVGNGYSECIIMKDNMEVFIKEISNLGILIPYVDWWCYVNPNESTHTGCPHGLGGPRSEYYEGWFSELQNDIYELDEAATAKVLLSYDKQLIYSLNMRTLDEIRKMLEIPFRYSPNDYIVDNKCVNPSLYLLIPFGKNKSSFRRIQIAFLRIINSFKESLNIKK